MIDFSEELKKFKPVLELDQIEDSIYNDEMKDIVELLSHVANKPDER